jgi:hypothetical protein
MSSFSLTQAQALHGQAAAQRLELWPVTVTLKSDTSDPKIQFALAGSPAKRSRRPQEQGSGFVQSVIRFYTIPQALALVLDLGEELTVVADAVNPQNVGTVWRVYDLDDSSSGSERTLGTYRLD